MDVVKEDVQTFRVKGQERMGEIQANDRPLATPRGSSWKKKKLFKYLNFRLCF